MSMIYKRQIIWVSLPDAEKFIYQNLYQHKLRKNTCF